MQSIRKKIASISIGLLVGLVLAEIALKIYNPMPSRIRGDEIILKTNLSQQVSIEPHIAGLDKTIRHSLNNIGFRGDDFPENPGERFKIIVVGGSTTECSILDDKKTWSALLGKSLQEKTSNLWINNAGIDGCSSYGHLILMRDHILKLKPEMVLFLVGINDVAKMNFEDEDGFLIERDESWLRSLAKKSELATLVSNIAATFRTRAAQVGHRVDLKGIDSNLSAREREKDLQAHRAYQSRYRTRLDSLLQICQSNKIEPVLLTQPLFLDSSTHSMQVMEIYNKTLISLGQANDVLVIDLAAKMEKEEALFYDNLHFTNQGAERVAEIIAQELESITPPYSP